MADLRLMDDWPTLANIIREVDGNHDLGAGELAERIISHARFSAVVSSAVEWGSAHEALVAATHGQRDAVFKRYVEACERLRDVLAARLRENTDAD